MLGKVARKMSDVALGKLEAFCVIMIAFRDPIKLNLPSKRE